MNDTPQIRSLGSLIDSEIVEVVTGFPFGGHNENGTGVPHIRPFNITTNGEISLEQIKSIPHSAVKGKPRLRRGDVVFNNTNSKELVGKCALWNFDMDPVFSNHMTRIRVLDRSCDAVYLGFAILHHWITGRSEMLARAHVAQASIMGERFREIEVPWPSMEDQYSIATMLKCIRESCQSETRQEVQSLQLKASAMRELFTRGLRGEPQKEAEIGLVPESWEVTTLGYLCDDSNSRIQTGPFGSQLHAHEYKFEGIPVINPTHLEGNRINHENVPRIDKATARRLERHKVVTGDILFGRRGEIGRHGLVSDVESGWICGTGCFLVRVRHANIDNAYLSYLFSTETIVDWLVAHAAGTIMPNLNNVVLSRLPVAYPTLSEQRELVAILDAIDRKIDLHRRKRALLDELFKSLLHKLMTGEVRVSDLDLSALPSADAQEVKA